MSEHIHYLLQLLCAQFAVEGGIVRCAANDAFADATLNDGCEIYDSWAAIDKDGGNYNLLQDLKATNPHLKTLIS